MLAIGLGLFAGVSWSVHDLLARKFANSVGSYTMAVCTMVAGSLLLGGYVLWNSQIWHAGSETLALVLVLGVIYAIAVSSLFKAFSMAPVSIVGPFTAGYPALIVLWGLIAGLTPSALQGLAVVLILAGAIVVGRTGPDDGGLKSVAKEQRVPLFLFCLLAVLCFAAAAVLGQVISQTLGEIETTALCRIPAAFFLLPFAFAEKPAVAKIDSAAWRGIAAMALLDVAAVAGINYLGRLPGKEFGAMGISSYGAISVLLAMVFLKEKVSPWQWAGIAMIVVGVCGLTVPQ